MTECNFEYFTMLLPSDDEIGLIDFNTQISENLQYHGNGCGDH